METQPLTVTEEVLDAMIVLGRNRQKIEDVLNVAQKKGQVNILINCNPKFPHVSLLPGSRSLPVFFAEISPRKAISVEELFPGNNPYILIVDANSTNLESVAKEIPMFLRSHYPAASNLSIAVFDSQADFRKNNPVLVIWSNLATASPL